MKQSNVKILKNKSVAVGACRMILSAPQIAKAAKPGQFVMVRPSDTCAPLLRRPLGVHYVRGGNIELLYEVIGEGTKLLSQKKNGEYLDIIGPLGNGFDCFYVGHSTTNILVAGGVGTAPLLFLAQRLKRWTRDESEAERSLPEGDGRGTTVLIGAKTKNEILCEKEFKALGCDVRIATDDGSKGYKGFVTELMKALVCHSEGAKRPKNLKREILRPFGAQNDMGVVVYACGPKPMLQEVAKIAVQHNVPAQVSLEAHMACGIGACLGCIVNTKSGYKRVCKEGPVFDARGILWE